MVGKRSSSIFKSTFIDFGECGFQNLGMKLPYHHSVISILPVWKSPTFRNEVMKVLNWRSVNFHFDVLELTFVNSERSFVNFCKYCFHFSFRENWKPHTPGGP